MDALYEGSPPGLPDAEAGIRYVRTAVEELELLAGELARLRHLDWRSPAADDFADVLREHLAGLRRTSHEFEAAADALTQYADELRTLDPEDG